MMDFWKKRRKEEQDAFGDLDEFDFDDLGFESEKVDDDRSPVLKATKNIVTGTKDSLISGNAEDTFRKVMPDGYSDVLDVKNELVDSYKEIVDESVKQFKPVMRDLKRITEKTVKNNEKVIPKKIYDKLLKLTEKEKTYGKEKGQEVKEEAVLSAELAKVFEAKSEVDMKIEAKREKDDQLKGVVDWKKHTESVSQLDAIRRATISLSDYNDNINLKYQRKSLELQFRQTHTLIGLLTEAKAARAESKSLLEAVKKNTGLPDYVKLKGSERFMATASQRFYDNAVASIYGTRNNYVSRFIQEAKKSAKGWVSGFAGQLSNITGAVGMASDMTDGMGDEDGVSKSSMAGMMAGDAVKGMITGKMKKFLSGESTIAGRKFKYADDFVQGGAKASMIVRNLPYYMSEFISSHGGLKEAEDAIEEIPGKKKKKSMLGKAKSFIRSSDKLDPVYSALGHIHRQTISSMNRVDGGQIDEGGINDPGVFTNRVSRSITDVIPSYLAHMLKELTITLTLSTTLKS